MIPTARQVMRVEHFGPPSALTMVTEPLPTLGPDDVLVKVTAIGVNFADTMVRRGEYRRDQVLPQIPGMEVAGTVVHAPPRSGLLPGATVVVFMENGGGYTDYAIAPAEMVFPVPADMSGPDVAAAFLQGVTAWYAVHRYGRVAPRETVLVTGAAGGLGGTTVQLARDAGARVFGTASTALKRGYTEDLGCEAALDPADDELAKKVRALTDGRGVDVVIDGVGGDLFKKALACLARNGRFVVVGSATQQPAMLDVRQLLPRGQTIAGFVVRNVMDSDHREPARALEEVLLRVKNGVVKLPQEKMPLAEAGKAHELIESRLATGKIVLIP